MMGRKMNRPNEGIVCSVTSCFYHESGDYCTAEKIHVEPRDATSVEQTDCATFRMK